MVLKFKTVIILGIICLGISVSTSRDRERVLYHLERGSRLWIAGSATLGSYECGTVAVYGTGNLDSDSMAGNSGSIKNNSNKGAKVAVLVKLFDCGNPAMNEDMYDALKADRDSMILYELTDAKVIYDSTDINSYLGLRTIGNLTIAGITRKDTIDTDVKCLPDRKYEIVGKKNLSMLDFKIVPPSAFFGLIKADERLVVSFDLIAAPAYENLSEKSKYVIHSP